MVELRHRWRDAEDLQAHIAGVTDCIHLGWYASPRDYLSSVEGNLASLQSSVELLQALAASGCRSLVAAGSQAEYAQSDDPLREDGVVEPRSVYGAAKAGFHLLSTSSMARGTLAVAWARLFNVVGPGEHPDRLIPSAARALLAGRPMDLSPGRQLRDYIDVNDTAGALIHLSNRRVAGPFNICTAEGVTLHDFVAGLGDRLGRRELLRFGARPYGDHEPMKSVGTNERLVGTGWVRRHSTDDTLDRIVAYWSEAGDRPPGS